ncbi:OsmC family protein [Promethearchaeum syntrophicum]|uniref:OsmC family protein n=1 Tax=Promethearchaeum syntrophicum TaxID=2594042 RepID=A0A5B9D9B2_9ARCH|nr:OsmC family protein [Candidatus Prometheoarchaeum syntrophicum]QEE15848.1 OsmC-like protein [Candidatus Prometheoarchaeum syntrophicum]
MLIESARIAKMKKNFTELKKIHNEINHSDRLNKTIDSTPFETKYEVTSTQIENFQLSVIAGEHSAKLDEPLSIAGDNTAMNAVQMLISAFASCLETNWLFYITAYNLNVKDVRVHISALIDRRYSLGIIPARVKSFVITSKLITEEPMEKIEKIAEKAKKTCVVGGSIHPEIERIYHIEIQKPN